MKETSTIFLEKEFIGKGEVKGCKFTQISSTGVAYLYEVEQNDKTYYEVIKRLISPICIDFENKVYSETEFKEVYPKANKFGIDGFTLGDLESAEAKLELITKNIENECK